MAFDVSLSRTAASTRSPYCGQGRANAAASTTSGCSYKTSSISREIDEVLYEHPDVVEAAAFARPCPQYGERVEAAVRLSETSNATEEELRALCETKVGAFKSPEKVHILAELPKGPSGKIQRLYLNEILYGA